MAQTENLDDRQIALELKQLLLQSIEKTKSLQLEIKELSKKFATRNACPELRRDWTPKLEVQEFLGFANTQMAAQVKKYKVIYTEIGKQKFYSNKSLGDMLNNNIQGV